MTDELKDVLNRVLNWPRERQDDAIRILTAMEQQDASLIGFLRDKSPKSGAALLILTLGSLHSPKSENASPASRAFSSRRYREPFSRSPKSELAIKAYSVHIERPC
jgi:hypothetical protein